MIKEKAVIKNVGLYTIIAFIMIISLQIPLKIHSQTESSGDDLIKVLSPVDKTLYVPPSNYDQLLTVRFVIKLGSLSDGRQADSTTLRIKLTSFFAEELPSKFIRIGNEYYSAIIEMPVPSTYLYRFATRKFRFTIGVNSERDKYGLRKYGFDIARFIIATNGLGQPGGLIASEVTSTSVKLKWGNRMLFSAGNFIYRSRDNYNFELIAETHTSLYVTGYEYTDVNLEASTKYYYKVSTVHSFYLCYWQSFTDTIKVLTAD